eukprot:COSAG05_NODE_10204_length_578_cov_0.544885_1_plen_148_part_10
MDPNVGIASDREVVWEHIDQATGATWPAARTDHAAAPARGLLWVAGGQDPIGRAEAGCASQYLPFDVWTFDPTSKTWTEEDCAGAPPSARACHQLVRAGDGRTLAIMGGGSDEGPLNDLHLLDSVTRTWSQLLLAPNTAPAPREMHAC